MGVVAIELNDAGIRAARAGGDALLPVDGEREASPGFAWRREDSIVTGAAAAAEAYIAPLHVHDRFWDQLDTEPADPRDSASPSRAVVACAHLRAVAERIGPSDDGVVVAVPPIYGRRQLGILVGIARELGLPLRGLVASPVAIDDGAPNGGSILVVDLGLHRSALSVVASGERVVLDATRTSPHVGLLALRRQWAKAITGEFVRRTRFDPLHDARTEQTLHDRLPELIESVARAGSEPLELRAQSRTHRVTVTDQLLAQAGHGIVFELCRDVQALTAAHPVEAIVLAHDAARVPGLEFALRRQTVTPVRALAPGAAALGLSRLWPDRFDHSAGEGVAYHGCRAGVEHAAPPSTGVAS